MVCCSQVCFSKPQSLCLAAAPGELCYYGLAQSVPAEIRVGADSQHRSQSPTGA